MHLDGSDSNARAALTMKLQVLWQSVYRCNRACIEPFMQPSAYSIFPADTGWFSSTRWHTEQPLGVYIVGSIGNVQISRRNSVSKHILVGKQGPPPSQVAKSVKAQPVRGKYACKPVSIHSSCHHCTSIICHLPNMKMRLYFPPGILVWIHTAKDTVLLQILVFLYIIHASKAGTEQDGMRSP